VHASYVPDSKSFIICEDNAKDITQYLPAALMVSGFDAVEPGGTDYCMNAIGKIGICLECGYLGDAKSTRTAEEGIIAFLQARGHIAGIPTSRKRAQIRIYDLYFTKTDSFNLTKKYADFDTVAKGELIGLDGMTEVRAEKDSIILFARDVQSQGEEAFLLGEYVSS
jgi:predicted deacylase